MLFKDGMAITELKREDKDDAFVVEFAEFKKNYSAYIKRRGAYRLVSCRPRGKNKLQGLMEPAQRANIEMKSTKVGEDGIIHDYMWAKGMPKVVKGEKVFNGSQYYWLWSGNAYLDGNDVEIAFFLEKYSDQFNKLFKKNDLEANAKAKLDLRRNLSFLDYTLSNDEAVYGKRDALNVLAKAFEVNYDESQSDYEVADAIRDEIAVDLDKGDNKFLVFKGIVDDLKGVVEDEVVNDDVTAQTVWAMDYAGLKEEFGVTSNIPKKELVEKYCEKYKIEYKEKDSN